MKRILLICLSLLIGFAGYGQNGIVGQFSGISFENTGFFTDVKNESDQIVTSTRLYVATSATTGDKYFRLVRAWDNDFTQFGPSENCNSNDYNVSNSNGLIIDQLSSFCSGKAFFVNVTSTGDRYIFKTPNGNSATSFVYFKVSGELEKITQVNYTVPQVGQDAIVSAVANATLPTGQSAYLRYSVDNFQNSTVLEMAPASATSTYEATIPASVNTKNANVSFYVFTSGSGLSINHSQADLYSINLNNNNKNNYSYTPQCPEYGVVGVSPASLEVSGGSVTITLSTPQQGVPVYYTTDGSTPSAQSTLYEGSFSVSGCGNTVNLRAVAIDANGCFSMEGNEVYNFTKPVIGISQGGNFPSGTAQVTLLTDNATLYYTTDGSTPTTSSTQYTTPFNIYGSNGCNSISVRAIAVQGNCASDEASSIFTFDQGMTVYFQNTLGWDANSIRIFYFGEQGTTLPTIQYPGVLMQNENNNNWFSFTFDHQVTSTNLIFNNGGTDENQTVDLSRVKATDLNSYFIPSNELQDGKQTGDWFNGVPLDLVEVTAPTTPSASPVSATQISISWVDLSEEDGYELQRSTNSDFCSGVTNFSLNANQNTFNDTNLSPGTTYYYRVRAFKNNNQ